MDLWSFWSACMLGFFCGVVARIVTPGDAFRHMSGLRSWLLSLVLGLAGALVGYWIFTGLFDIGDSERFDWGGLLGALIGTVIVLVVASALIRRSARRKAAPPVT